MKKSERITALEAEVAALKIQVASLMSRPIHPLPVHPPIYPGIPLWPYEVTCGVSQ